MTIIVWSKLYPAYAERMRVMSLPQNVAQSLIRASKMSLVPKD